MVSLKQIYTFFESEDEELAPVVLKAKKVGKVRRYSRSGQWLRCGAVSTCGKSKAVYSERVRKEIGAWRSGRRLRIRGEPASSVYVD